MHTHRQRRSRQRTWPLAYRGRRDCGLLRHRSGNRDIAAIGLVSIRANGQPAVAAYARTGHCAAAYGIMVLTVRDGQISQLTGFADPSLFSLFGLPQQTACHPATSAQQSGGTDGL